MPQEIQVVQCYNCSMYQTDIAKKANKWTCKLCGEKQTLKHVFGKGNGKECRLHVQKLNDLARVNESNHYDNQVSYRDEEAVEKVTSFGIGKWAHLMDTENDISNFDDNPYSSTSLGHNFDSQETVIKSSRKSAWSAFTRTQDNDSEYDLLEGAREIDENTFFNSTNVMSAGVSSKVDNNTIGNANSKWSQFLQTKSDNEEEEEETSEAYKFPATRQTKRKNLFGDSVSIENLFDNC